MAARAMWKGVVRFEEVRLPVKLYAAIQDRAVRFRLLHEEDGVPVKQRMINPVTGRFVEHSQAQRGLEVEPDLFVILRDEELAELEPEASRDIRISRFVPPGAINHQWYDRPYFLGPDGNDREYRAFVEALARRRREGVARWTMRKKAYLGAVQPREGPGGGHLLLMTLRHAGEVISAADLEPPEGRELQPREREMARKFIGALEDEFDPEDYRDEYRDRLMELIERKRRGEEIAAPPEPMLAAAEPDDLSELLERSLAGVGS
jgi:DNA end-binding protein Ku